MYKQMILVVIGCLVYSGVALAAEVRPVVTHESTVFSYTSPGNGSGPFWNRGCTTIVRMGNSVIVCEQETGKDVPLLCNTRWRLHKRTGDTWELVSKAEGYRQREPAILGTLNDTTLLLNVNDSVMPAGVHYGKCDPHTIKFSMGEWTAPTRLKPEWAPDTNFTDHSYRSFSVDRGREEVLMLNINAGTSAEFYALMDAEGKTVAKGTLEFPIRSCYAQTALVDGAAYVLAISDIVEPVAAWREFKFKETERKWDYVFRILYFTYAKNLREGGFSEAIEIDNVDDTAGALWNQDMHVAANGDAYVLYTKRAVASALMQQKYFPELSLLVSLELAVVRDGKVISRKTILEAKEESKPGCSRFHVGKEGQIYIVSYATLNGVAGNWLMPLSSLEGTPKFIPIPLSKPMSTFFLADTRAGNAPSDIIDMFGAGANRTMVNAEVRLVVGE